jgi:uncharacterized damage-inducible protein DinB
MELTPSTALAYVELAFGQLREVAERLGDDKVSERPMGPHTNSVAALVTHCCGVCEFWLGHVGLGRPSHRDRDAEFEAVAAVDELRDRIDAALAQVEADLRALPVAAPSPNGRHRDHLVDPSDASLVLHVIEELFQHLGHAELAADALGVPKGDP